MLLQSAIITLFAVFFGYLFKMSTGAQNVLTATYQAPLRGCGEGDVVSQSYIVYLAPGHSLEQHSAIIKKDITPYVEHIYDMYTEKVVYVGKRIDQDLLQAIRADKRVELVECDGIPEPDAEL
jgi:hypothetical protein